MTERVKPGEMVIASLRKMIVTGELETGERIAEIPTAAVLGVSRMPVRTALRTLEHEGLVTRLGARGFAARRPEPMLIDDAVEVRGVLEGLAAARVALRGMDAATDKEFSRLLSLGDALFVDACFTTDHIERYGQYNACFHRLLIDSAASVAIERALKINNHLPFASASALAVDRNDPGREARHLLLAHRQHHDTVGHIRRRDAPAAERSMRDHARMATMGEAMLILDASRDPLSD